MHGHASCIDSDGLIEEGSFKNNQLCGQAKRTLPDGTVEEGIFDVLSRRNGVDVKVNSKSRGDIFGEISLLLESPRTATVVSASRGAVWVLDRARFRALTRKAAVESNLQNEVFLNSVPAFADLESVTPDDDFDVHALFFRHGRFGGRNRQIELEYRQS